MENQTHEHYHMIIEIALILLQKAELQAYVSQIQITPLITGCLMLYILCQNKVL